MYGAIEQPKGHFKFLISHPIALLEVAIFSSDNGQMSGRLKKNVDPEPFLDSTQI